MESFDDFRGELCPGVLRGERPELCEPLFAEVVDGTDVGEGVDEGVDDE